MAGSEALIARGQDAGDMAELEQIGLQEATTVTFIEKQGISRGHGDGRAASEAGGLGNQEREGKQDSHVEGPENQACQPWSLLDAIVGEVWDALVTHLDASATAR